MARERGRERGAIGTLVDQILGGRIDRKNGPTVRLWRVGDGAPGPVLAGHSDNVFSVAVSPDGKWLATGSLDKTVGLWALRR